MSGGYDALINDVLLGTERSDAWMATRDAVVSSLESALSNLRPARISTAHGALPGPLQSTGGDSAVVDSTAAVLAVQDESGLLAYVVNAPLAPAYVFGTEPRPDRGIAGNVTEAIRGELGTVPVLVTNSAAGDLAATPDPATAADALAALAQTARKAEAAGEIALAVRTRSVALPPTVLGDLAPQEALITEALLDSLYLASVPGVPAGQVGMLVRVRSAEAGYERALLLANAQHFIGPLPTIPGYIAATETTRFAFYGPVLPKWAVETYLPTSAEEEAAPVWGAIPMLDQHRMAYEQGRTLGAEQRAQLTESAVATADALGKMAPMLNALGGDLPPEAQALIGRLEPAQLVRAAQQLAGAFVRAEFIDFTPEQWIKLMGVSEGAQLPFDSVLLMQFLVSGQELPGQASGIVRLIKGMAGGVELGYDFF